MEQQEPILPKPQEQQPRPPEAEGVAEVEFLPASKPETAPVRETPIKSAPAKPAQDDQASAAQTPVISGTAPATADSAADIDAPPIADDVDVLEKEWVDKAKNIVEKTKDDPYQQKKEVSYLKADYMKKRYGKEIKVSND